MAFLAAIPIGVYAAIASGAGAAVSAGSAIAGGVGAANAGADALKRARVNAIFVEQAANRRENQGAEQAGQIRMQASKIVDAQRAAYGASGVDVSTGSPAQVAASSRMYGELDAQTAKMNAVREAWGMRVHASDILDQGQQAKAMGDAQMLGSFASAGGTLLTSAADIYGRGQKAEWWKDQDPAAKKTTFV